MAADPTALAELDNRISILRDNLRELVEQAAAYSGAADESRNADRIADQQAKLDALLAERDKLASSRRRPAERKNRARKIVVTSQAEDAVTIEVGRREVGSHFRQRHSRSGAAYWLAAEGFRPTLVERAPRLRSGGYIIDFWGSGYDVAERMGLLPELLRQGYDIRELRLVDTYGHRVGGFRADVFRELTFGRYTTVARSDLARLIYRSVEDRCESIFGDSVKVIEQDGEGVRVAFEHMPERRFDIVIGADGLHSPVRRLVFGAEDRFEKYLGYCVAAFEVEGYRPRDELVYVSYAIPGKQVARFSMRGDRTLFLFVFASERPPTIDAHGTQAFKRVLQSEFADAGWNARRSCRRWRRVTRSTSTASARSAWIAGRPGAWHWWATPRSVRPCSPARVQHWL